MKFRIIPNFPFKNLIDVPEEMLIFTLFYGFINLSYSNPLAHYCKSYGVINDGAVFIRFFIELHQA